MKKINFSLVARTDISKSLWLLRKTNRNEAKSIALFNVVAMSLFQMFIS